MATAISRSTKERTNFVRLCRLLIDGGTKVLKDVFDKIYPAASLHGVLHTASVHNSLKTLRGKRVLTTQQWQRLYPSSTVSPVTSSDFDITLLFLLLRNICSLTQPATGWDKLPAASDKSREADLVRVKFYRNNIFAHISETSINDGDFEKYWNEIGSALVRLGGAGYATEIQRLKVESVDAKDEEFYTRILEEWEHSEKNLMSVIKETENRMTAKLDKQQQEIAGKLDEAEQRITVKLDEVKEVFKRTVNSDGPETSGETAASESVTHYNVTVKDNALVAVGNQASTVGCMGHSPLKAELDIRDNYILKIGDKSSSLKATTRWQTELQLKLVASHMMPSVKTDDIFTSLVIQYGRKAIYNDKGEDFNISRDERLEWYGKVSGIPVKRCQEIFEGNPKSILVIGKPGIGKSLFCQKLIRDWACNRLIVEESSAEVPNFKFAYLLTFRQLSSHGNDTFDLIEILNRSLLLDEYSTVDNMLFEYMLHHQNEVLIIVDGFDEYSKRYEITDNSEERFPNDPRVKMPVSAMCSKLIKGKVLRDSVILITSRPGEADEMGGVDFDEYVEITGFSSPQVKEYIEKYFKKDEKTKNVVLHHIMSNENLVSFGHIPVLCFIMCWYMEWHVQYNSEFRNYPVTLTELCTEVIEVFVRRHHSELKGRKSRPEDRRRSSVELLGSSLLQVFNKRRNSRSQENLEDADISPFAEKVLDKLSKLAAKFLIEKKLSFGNEDMESFSLSRQETDNLKASGLLQCGPGFRISAFEVDHYFCFTHLILHECLAAFWFVKERKMPTNDMATGMVCQFMAGIMSTRKDGKLMEKLINWIKTLPTLRKDQKHLLTAKCLFEFKDREFAKVIVLNLYDRYWEDGIIVFLGVTDVDCIMIAFLLDIFSSLNEKHTKTKRSLTSSRKKSLTVKTLYIGMSSLTLAGFKQISNSLCKEFCNVTEVEVYDCGIKDECACCLGELLVKSQLTYLDMGVNKLTDESVASLCNSLIDKRCKLTRLLLSYNEIGDKGAQLLCRSVLHENCKLSRLVMYKNNLTEECKKSLKELVQKQKPDFDLRL